MIFNRTTPTAWIVTAVTGGVLFVIGGIATTMSTTPRLVMAGGAVAFIVLGIYTGVVVRRNVSLTEKNEDLISTIDDLRKADSSLRTRMAYTLRDPLTSIVGFSDHMVESPNLPFDEQREMLVAIRSDAREVERALSDLAEIEASPGKDHAVEGVVLLDDEIASVASSITTDAVFQSDLGRSRAWGDSAKVRQILRTVLNAATESGCAHITLESRQGVDVATATVSGREELLSSEAVAALTGNTQLEDLQNSTYQKLRAAYELAASLDGTIGYAQAFGSSHIVVELPAAPTELGVTAPRISPAQPFELSFASAVDLRPERPTSYIHFAQ